jgi:hypothetical protein
MNADKLNFKILPNGTIVVESDKVSEPNHASADEFLELLATLAGGEVTVKGHDDARHSYEHAHDHEHVHSK